MPVDEIDEEMHYGEDEVDSDDDQESFDESEEEGAAETEEEVDVRNCMRMHMNSYNLALSSVARGAAPRSRSAQVAQPHVATDLDDSHD